MKVYCIFEDYNAPYPEDSKSTLVKIFDSIEKANAFIEEQTKKERYFYDEEYDCSLSGRIKEWDVE